MVDLAPQFTGLLLLLGGLAWGYRRWIAPRASTLNFRANGLLLLAIYLAPLVVMILLFHLDRFNFSLSYLIVFGLIALGSAVVLRADRSVKWA